MKKVKINIIRLYQSYILKAELSEAYLNINHSYSSLIILT